jgi:hypothetical protein
VRYNLFLREDSKMRSLFFVLIALSGCTGLAQESSIEGELGYPAEILPGQKVCAVEIPSLKETCTQSKQAQIKYKIDLSPGKYQVYASLLAPMGSITPAFKAYYTEYAACGLKRTCPSHEIIEFDLKKGEHKKQVNPIDWSRNR